MKKLALVAILLVAGCKKSGPRVPAAFASMVPTKGLRFASQHDPIYTGKNELSGTLLYDGVDGAELREAFAARIGALDGYVVILSCSADDGFSVAAVKKPHDSVMVNMSHIGDRSYRGEISVGPANWLGLPPDADCRWAPAAKDLCDFAGDPQKCDLAAR